MWPQVRCWMLMMCAAWRCSVTNCLWYEYSVVRHPSCNTRILTDCMVTDLHTPQLLGLGRLVSFKPKSKVPISKLGSLYNTYICHKHKFICGVVPIYINILIFWHIRILVSAPVPLGLFGFLNLLGRVRVGSRGLGLGLDNIVSS